MSQPFSGVDGLTPTNILMPAITTAATTSPADTNVQLPHFGVWLVSLETRVGKNTNDMLAGTWLVYFYAGDTNDTLSAQQIGATAAAAGSPYGASTLTLGNPSDTGVMVATSAWTNGATVPMLFKAIATQIAGLGKP